jgi:hypothetical protein
MELAVSALFFLLFVYLSRWAASSFVFHKAGTHGAP